MIDCSASAFPALTGSITLTRDGDPVTLDQDNTYTVVSARTRDAGTYECSATNEIGLSTLTIEVEVGDVPDSSSQSLAANGLFVVLMVCSVLLKLV